MSTFLTQIACEVDDAYSVLIEDDGRVAYAYLLEFGDVIGDVWLYNQDEAPTDSNWAMQSSPYLNPREFLADGSDIKPIKDEKELRCEWTLSASDSSVEVGIYIRDKFVASIESGSKPGWSVLVVKDGPLALVY
ncbi:hypothetical protein [Mucilaginibacter myungsuensis]|uniref:Uncharacterized protein n=1 Tax=Mucilaginibacter myungsuensis TaxID=649104 RepID=A0A929KXM2_9SPHI|nr:hypothetical protein [Mucilaginibacter myungsuensis]MBE9662338.1 hypothetical protein [Mucilaginibacter myungsuensis]MDN3599225.1 hypothetical protein [Mucilaginibacter myungsuensis]